MSKRVFCGIPKMCALIFAHAATKSIALWSSLSQTKWSVGDFFCSSLSDFFKFFNASANTSPHFAILHLCWSLRPYSSVRSLLQLATAARLLNLFIRIFDCLSDLTVKVGSTASTNLCREESSIPTVSVVAYSSTNCPYWGDTWYRHEITWWTISRDRIRRIRPTVLWKLESRYLCCWIQNWEHFRQRYL